MSDGAGTVAPSLTLRVTNKCAVAVGQSVLIGKLCGKTGSVEGLQPLL